MKKSSTTKKIKLGRPALPANKKRRLTISFRATADEQARIERAAKLASTRATTWVRNVVLSAVGD